MMNIRQFSYTPAPYYLPRFMNAFNWSLPFAAEKLMDMILALLRRCDEVPDDEEGLDAPALRVRGDTIRAKIRSVAKLSIMLSTLRQESETIIELKGLAGGRIPRGLLALGATAIRSAVGDFDKAKELDAENEKRPTLSREESIPLRPRKFDRS
jgi:serine/threonine-protein phosphatase 2B catalytic subunit